MYRLNHVFWLIPALMLVTALLPDQYQALLIYDRNLVINEWQLWRLLSGHFVHWNQAHLLLNVIGFILVLALGNDENFRESLIVIALLFLLTGSSLVLFKSISYYAGISSVTYGLFCFYLLQNHKVNQKIRYFLLFLCLLKLFLEYFGWLSTAKTASIIDSSVATPIHLVAVMIGMMSYFLMSALIVSKKD